MGSLASAVPHRAGPGGSKKLPVRRTHERGARVVPRVVPRVEPRVGGRGPRRRSHRCSGLEGLPCRKTCALAGRTAQPASRQQVLPSRPNRSAQRVHRCRDDRASSLPHLPRRFPADLADEGRMTPRSARSRPAERRLLLTAGVISTKCTAIALLLVLMALSDRRSTPRTHGGSSRRLIVGRPEIPRHARSPRSTPGPSPTPGVRFLRRTYDAAARCRCRSPSRWTCERARVVATPEDGPVELRLGVRATSHGAAAAINGGFWGLWQRPCAGSPPAGVSSGSRARRRPRVRPLRA